MPRLIVLCLFSLCFTLLTESGHGAPANYAKGVAAFENKDWPAAREAFEAVIEKDQTISNDLLFNLGNTLFREDNPGRAALWYRRALLLDPRDASAKQNLRLLQRRTGALEFTPSTGRTVASWLPHRHWRWVLAATAWTVALALAALLFLRLRGAARTWTWVVLGLALPSTALAAWGTRSRLDPGEASRRAIVIPTSTSALAAPTDTAGVIIDLPPGSEVIIKEARDMWTYVEIPGEMPRVGWVRSTALAPLWPYSPTLIE